MKRTRNTQNYILGAGVMLCVSALAGILSGWPAYFSAVSILLAAAAMILACEYSKHEREEIRNIIKSADEVQDFNELIHSDLWQKIPYHEDLGEIIEKHLNIINARKDMESYDRQASLQALQSQINPHFLYNTLECIRGQALLDHNSEIATMLEALGDFFRYSISRRENIVLLRDEIKNIKEYLLIQNYRFPDRFDLQLEYLEDRDLLDSCYVPKLMLQPIVENAILHAFADRMKGTLTIQIDADEDHLLITVSDNGCGMSESALSELNARIHGERDSRIRPAASHGNGIALVNVNKRINVLFGPQYGIHVYSSQGIGTDVEIVLRQRTDEHNES